MIFLNMFLTFFKIGLFTVGGGYAMLPFIQSEVLANGWLGEQEIINFIAVSESTPGPFAVNIATYVGSQVGSAYGSPIWSVIGSACATLGVVLPSFIVILIVARFFEKFKENKYVRGAMSGLRPAVVGLIGAAIISMILTVFLPDGTAWTALRSTLQNAAFYISLTTTAVMTVLAFKKVHPIIIICLSALIGIASGYALGW